MSCHPIVLGLAAALALTGGALASEPVDTQAGIDRASSQRGVSHASPAQPASDTQAASQPAEAASETSTEDAAAAADAAAEGVEEAVEQPAPRDWSKASRKEVADYNATVAADQRIVCRVNSSTAARIGKKLCLTATQWRELK